jgi:Protein of unknown function (DUF1573)
MTTRGILLLSLSLITPVFAQLKWDQPKQTLIPQPGQKVVTARFGFTNAGSSPVTIIDVHPSCGCTTATLAKKEYAPGESGEIEAKLNFAGHVGHQEKWIYVTTNVAGSEPALLSLAVDIPPEVTIQPEFVMWRVGDPLEPKTMRVVIPEGIPTKLVAAQADSPRMQVRLREVQAGKEWEVKVTPTSTREAVEAVVTIRSDYPAGNPITYSAHARVQ